MDCPILNEVLYSLKDLQWKLADYGFIPGNPFVRSITTKRSAKDGVYDAPEIIVGDEPYTSKADIWSLGCLIFEIIFQQNAFPDCIEALKYANNPMLATSLPVNVCTVDQDSAFYETAKSFIIQAFKKDIGSRPTAHSFLENLEKHTEGHQRRGG